MHRFFLFVFVCLLSAHSLVGVSEAQDLSIVKQEIVQLSDTVYLIVPNPPYGGNLAVSVGDDGILLVDDQMMPMTPGIREAIASLQEGRVEYLINTHYSYFCYHRYCLVCFGI